KRAVELNNVDLDYQAYYAYSMYLVQGSSSFEEVRDILQRAVKKDPKNGTAYDFMGRIFRAEGNLKQAAIHLQKAIEISPRNADAQRELRVVQMRLSKQTDDGKGGFFKGLLKR
ncbi:MAG: tetratricopeptide repeat protein, partial [Myxococcota bacterium]